MIVDVRTAEPERRPGERARGRLSLTVSMLLSARSAVDNVDSPAVRDNPLERAVSPYFHNVAQSDPNTAITPFFTDVADRDREIYFGSGGDLLLPGLGTETIDLLVGPTLEWETEGRRMNATLATAPLRFPCTCRSYWYLHSDGALSFHLGFELPYTHTLEQFLALSAIQETLGQAQEALESARRGDTGSNCAVFIRRTSEGPAAADQGSHPIDLPSFLSERLQAARTKLQQEYGDSPPPAVDDASDLPQLLRWLCVFEDPTLFNVLRDRRTLLDEAFDRFVGRPGNPDNKPATTDGLGLADALAELAAFHSAAQAPLASSVPIGHVYTERQLEIWNRTWSEAVLALIFMSGFTQGVIDFLRQDCSEVDDGSDPVFPGHDAPNGHTYWLLYANGSACYEVVARSRSIEAAREYIGTCPYLLLVHLMALHDEALTTRYEAEVRRLLEAAENGIHKFRGLAKKRDQAREANSQLSGVLASFRAGQFDIFLTVERYIHDNVFRYDTERAFFESIERVRGIDQRRRRWSDVLGRLSSTLDQEAKTLDEREQESLSVVVAGVTVLGIFQVLLAIPWVLREWYNSEFSFPQSISHWDDILFAVLFVITVFLLRHLLADLFRRLLKEASRRK